MMTPETIARVVTPSKTLEVAGAEGLGGDGGDYLTALRATHLKRTLFASLQTKADSQGATFWEKPVYTASLTFRLATAKSIVPPPELAKPEQLRWIGRALEAEYKTPNKLFQTLLSLTRSAAIVRFHDEMHPVVPEVFFDRFQTWPEDERDAFLRQWFSWVSHGDTWRTPDGVPSTSARDALLLLPGDDPSLSVTTPKGVFKAAVVFEVSPLFVDLAAGKGNYLVSVGLPWTGDLGSPDTWSSDERDAMWMALFGAFDEELRYAQSKGTTGLPPYVEALIPGPIAATANQIIEAPVTDLEAAPLADAVKEAEATAPLDANRPTFPVALAPVPMDREVLSVIQQSGRLTFPRQWSRIPRWERLVEDEKDRILNDPALSATAMTTGADGRPPLLQRRVVRGRPQDQWPVSLTDEAKAALKIQHGPRGFLKVDENTNAETFYKCVVQDSIIVVEMQINWHGLAGPFVADWRERQKAIVDERRRALHSDRAPLFDDLDEKELATLDRILRDVTLYERGQQAMEVIIGQVGLQRRDTVEIRADVFKTLFWPNGEAPQDWKQNVEAILTALRHVDIIVRKDGRKHMGGFLYSVETEDDQAKSSSSFRYIPRGMGAHGNGIYQLRVNEAFLGCLRFFNEGIRALRGGGFAQALNFGKKLSKEEKTDVHGKYVQVHAGTPFYSAGASQTQRNLIRFIESNITQKKDGLAGSEKGPRRSHKVRADNFEATLPRHYDASFCPLLPPGRTFVAALGHFKSVAPESGFTLFGTRTEARGGSGAKPGGLIEKLGRAVPPGNAHQKRRQVLEETVEDLRQVVEIDYGGIVVGRLSKKDTANGEESSWIPLDDFLSLDDHRLGNRLKVCMFLPPEWDDNRKAAFEERTGYRVTTDPVEAETAAWEGPKAISHARPGEVIGPDNGWRGLPLAARLEAKVRQTGMKKKDVAALFMVTPSVVTQWLAANKTDSKTPALRIPDDLAPLIVRWIEGGPAPTGEELNALASRARSPARPSRPPALEPKL